MQEPAQQRWLLLIHQIPPTPGYLRVKIARRLHRIGAASIKNTVYALPNTEEAHEDFQWVRREIVEGGGEAMICEAHLVDGLRDEDIEKLFNEARDADYREIVEQAQNIADSRTAGAAAHSESDLTKLKRRMTELANIDYFGAPGRAAAVGVIATLEERMRTLPQEAAPSPTSPRANYCGRTWVTRKNIGIDRLASAWLIRRFIDSQAKFLFVSGKEYAPKEGELRFDMFEGEFTHEGDCCSFEVLCKRMGLDDPALRPIAEIVHDMDLKDDKFQREEVAGIDRVIAGICMSGRDDEERLRRGGEVFNDLYEYFRKKPETQGGRP